MLVVETANAQGVRCNVHQHGPDVLAGNERGLNGGCDYLLTRSPELFFVNQPVIAVVEAKRQSKNVMSDLDQAERYSRELQMTPEMTSPGGPWGVSAAPR